MIFVEKHRKFKLTIIRVRTVLKRTLKEESGFAMRAKEQYLKVDREKTLRNFFNDMGFYIFFFFHKTQMKFVIDGEQ